MRRHAPSIAAVLALVAGVAFASSYFSSGPMPSYTGAPAAGAAGNEADCTTCHILFDDQFNVLPNLNQPGGAVEILGVPAAYSPGQEYALTVRLDSDSTDADPDRKWGFQLTAYRADTGEGAGTFVIPDPSILQIVVGDPGEYETRTYVEHTSDGTRTGAAGPVTWSFAWRAPAAGVGTVRFAAAGNAADGTFDPGQDWIYTTTASSQDIATPARAISWGSLKRRFR